MKAVILDASGPIERAPLHLRDLPDPHPGPGEILIRVSACGCCRTDLHVVEGELRGGRRPIVPGHQVVGRVVARGAGVASPREGERVGVAWLQGTCGTCEHCAEGAENLCLSPTFTGHHRDGGFAELMTARADWTYRLPEGLDDVSAAPLLCAGIIGYRALRRSRVRPGERLGLFGFGNSAHVTIQVARHEGIEVFVSSLADVHRRHARELGAAWAGGANELPPVPLHGAILFAPAGELVPHALRSLRRGGTLACAGIHLSPIPRLDYDELLFQERTLTSVTSNTREDGEALLRLAARIPVRTSTTVVPLEQANDALAAIKASRLAGGAVLVPA